MNLGYFLNAFFKNLFGIIGCKLHLFVHHLKTLFLAKKKLMKKNPNQLSYEIF